MKTLITENEVFYGNDFNFKINPKGRVVSFEIYKGEKKIYSIGYAYEDKKARDYATVAPVIRKAVSSIGRYVSKNELIKTEAILTFLKSIFVEYNLKLKELIGD